MAKIILSAVKICWHSQINDDSIGMKHGSSSPTYSKLDLPWEGSQQRRQGGVRDLEVPLEVVHTDVPTEHQGVSPAWGLVPCWALARMSGLQDSSNV